MYLILWTLETPANVFTCSQLAWYQKQSTLNLCHVPCLSHLRKTCQYVSSNSVYKSIFFEECMYINREAWIYSRHNRIVYKTWLSWFEKGINISDGHSNYSLHYNIVSLFIIYKQLQTSSMFNAKYKLRV